MRMGQVEEEEKGWRYMCKSFTLKALLVYLIDFIFDVEKGVFLTWPQDVMHIILFLSMLPIRFIGICLLRCMQKPNCEWKRIFYRELGPDPKKDKRQAYGLASLQNVFECGAKKNINEPCLLRKISRCGVLFLYEEERLLKFSRNHLLFVKFQFQRLETIKIFAHVMMMVAVAYFYKKTWILFDSKDLDNSWLGMIVLHVDDTIGYNIDISDVTFLCLYIVLRMMLHFARQIYYLQKIVDAVIVEEGKRICVLMRFIFCWMRVEDLSYYMDDEALDEKEYRMNKLNLRLVNFELLFVKLFCPEETIQKFRRRYTHWTDLVETDMSLHKDLVCGLIACSITFVVKFFKNYQYIQKFMSQAECIGQGHHCTTSVDDDNCWCTVNLIGHAPTFLIVVFAGVFGVASVMRVVVTYVFSVWLEPKYEKATWVMSTLKCGYEDKMTLPQKADVTVAIYGFPKNVVLNIIEHLRQHNYSTLPEIKNFFREDKYWIVTDNVQYYLAQGTTTFWLKPLESSGKSNIKPVMIVKGEWNGGRSSYNSKVRRMIECDAIQTICISKKETPNFRLRTEYLSFSPRNERSQESHESSQESHESSLGSHESSQENGVSISKWLKGGGNPEDLIWKRTPPSYLGVDFCNRQMSFRILPKV